MEAHLCLFRSEGARGMFIRALLVPLDGSRPIELTKDLTLVGRKEDCDLRLDHKSVSKLHCVIAKTDGLLLLRDLGSTNSTRVNGQRVRRAALLPNDQLTIANYKFRVQFGAGDEPAPPDEYTQQLDAKEVVKLLNRAEDDDLMDEDDEDGGPAQPAEFNPLPDVYPEEKPARKAK
jgi:pSer/pThr/pTyr-binding forkhead associated (FHA) protein